MRILGSTRDKCHLALFAGTLAASLALFVAPAAAQDDRAVTIGVPDQPNAIPLNTGPLPGATASESWHRQWNSPHARNVTEATLTPFLPDPAKATGTAVIVAPGGGFRTLSMENEGWHVAQALAEQGVAAFVLKYRLNQTPATLEEFTVPPPPRPEGAPPRPGRLSPEQMMANLGPQLADAQAAFALVRARADEWNVDPERIGMIGFSAGAMLTMATALGTDVEPAFLGDIYGPLSPVENVPADAPPLFVALAADDPLFPDTGFGLIQSWRAADRPVEFHYYEQGGHGFGMYDKTTTSTEWFDNFIAWMRMHGWLEQQQG